MTRMSLATKSRGLYLVIGMTFLFFFLMLYVNQMNQSGALTIDRMTDLSSTPELSSRFKSATPRKTDFPVLFLEEHNSKDNVVILNETSPRKYPFMPGNQRKMTSIRMHDNYRFCAKVAPFLGPYSFIKNTKSPCWYDEKGVFRCVPYFYLAGFSKSGTSDLFHKISGHPQIYSSGKEKHWFEFLRLYSNKDNIETYTNMFVRSHKRIETDIHEKGTSDLVIGDGTPCVMWHSLYWHCYEGNQGLTEPRYTNADVIHRINPQSKILVSMRDPVTRLYSRYLSMIKGLKDIPEYLNASPQSFHQLCQRAVDLYNSCFNDWSHRHCAYNGTLYTLAKLRLQEGMYSTFIKDWLKVFPKNQIHFLKFEDYVRDIKSYLLKIFKFLNIDELPKSKILEIANARPKNVGNRYGIGPMLNETKKLLQRFYTPFNFELQEMLGDNTSWLWGYEFDQRLK